MQEQPNSQNPRILFNGEKGTVKYRGKLQHKVDNAKVKVDEVWLGVEWDDETKGKHNGTVEGFKYFEAKGEKAGSLVVSKKAEFGQEIIEALIRRYFKDHEVNEILKNKNDILNYLKAKWEQELERIYARQNPDEVKPQPKPKKVKAPKEESQKDAAETNASSPTPTKDQSAQDTKKEDSDDMFEEDDPEDVATQAQKKESREGNVEKLFDKIKNKDCYTTEKAKTEYDEDAIINTFGNRYKRIEFKGFDKIWERIYNLDRIIEICLSSLRISDFGLLGTLGSVTSSLKNLSLEDNLLHNWSQIFVLGTELRRLESLSVSYNNLKVDDNGYDCKALQTYNSENQVKSVDDPKDVFPKLTKLIAISTKSTWAGFNHLMKFFPALTELVLCNNHCNDFDKMKVEEYKKIVSLNLENNGITDSSNFSVLGQLPELRDLALNKNNISRFAKAEDFKSLQNLNLSHNAIADGKIITDLRTCPKLVSLKINHNPIEQGMNKKDLTRRAVAELSLLTRINGMDLNRYERKDCEYYFLRWVFHEYFNLHNLHQLSYKFANFQVWAQENYPGVFPLIQKYDNPYPEVSAVAAEDEIKKLPVQTDHSGARFTKLLFTCPFGPMSGKPPVSKTFPRSTDFLYIRNWVSQTFKIKNKEAITIKFKNSQQHLYENIDDFTKTIEFYDLKDNADVLIEEKDA